MGWPSYAENIAERLQDAQNSIQHEIKSFRLRLKQSNPEKSGKALKDFEALKNRIERLMDDLEKKSQKLFDEAMAKVGDPRVHIFEKIQKKELQTTKARQDRDMAIQKRDSARKVNADLVGELDKLKTDKAALSERIKELATENAKLKRKIADTDDWADAAKGVKRR